MSNNNSLRHIYSIQLKEVGKIQQDFFFKKNHMNQNMILNTHTLKRILLIVNCMLVINKPVL